MHRYNNRKAEIVLQIPWLTLLVLFLLTCSPAIAQDDGDSGEADLGIAWIEGPAVGKLGAVANLDFPEGYIFAGPDDTRTLMESMQNPTSGLEMGLIAPIDSNWFVVFEFDGIGYVPDDERAELDGDAILKSLREGQKASNETRRQRGWETLEILGWMQAPHYDTESNNLEWATRLRSSTGEENVNYNSRLLGRRGVMSVTLVGSEEDVAANVYVFKSLLEGHQYNAGGSYAAFSQGDKIAKYGLTALITGGAAAVALKTGLLKKLWKPIAIGLAALFAAIKKFFGKGDSTPDPESGSESV